MTLWAAIAALSLTLCGCQVTGELENQAYVLVMAMDRADDGGLTLSARVPRIGKGGEKGKEGDQGGSPYLTFSVTAPSWSRALDALQWATPRRINLSHIEMIVASEALAAQPSFRALMSEVAETPHLYTNARFVVCPGSAKAFLEAGETVIGTRLSSEIHAMISQYAHQGYIPDACLADACFCANSIYGDPVAIWGHVEDETASGGDGASAVTASPMRQRFSGTALFRDGTFVRALTLHETRLLNLIRGQCDALTYEWRDMSLEITREDAPRRRVTIDGESVTFDLSLHLGAPDGISDADLAALEASVTDDVVNLIQTCQRLECDPFGFAESAAGHFATVPQWMAWDWRGRYRSASVNVEVRIHPRHTS